jgi:hypothetical protein
MSSLRDLCFVFSGVSLSLLLQRRMATDAASANTHTNTRNNTNNNTNTNANTDTSVSGRLQRTNSAAAVAAEKEGYQLADVVAGHSISQLNKESTKNDPVALVRDHLFLKPVQSDVRGEREVAFYETSGTCTAIPQYNGCENISSTKYLSLNNVEKEFMYPSTIDIKLGRQTFGPGATPAKMERARKKWKYMQQTAAAVCGMKVYHPVTLTYERLGKKYGRSLKLNGMLHALTTFLHNGHVVRIDVVSGLIQQLRERRSWLEHTCKYVCYSMSILLVYEGATTDHKHIMQDTTCEGSITTQQQPTSPVVVFVDFAHTFRKDAADRAQTEQMEGCLAGIDHVVDCLTMLQSLYNPSKFER